MDEAKIKEYLVEAKEVHDLLASNYSMENKLKYDQTLWGLIPKMYSACFANEHDRDSKFDLLADPVSYWFSERVVKKEWAKTKTSIFYEDYEKWCLSKGVPILNKAGFGRKMSSLADYCRDGKGRYYLNFVVQGRDSESGYAPYRAPQKETTENFEELGKWFASQMEVSVGSLSQKDDVYKNLVDWCASKGISEVPTKGELIRFIKSTVSSQKTNGSKYFCDVSLRCEGSDRRDWENLFLHFMLCLEWDCFVNKRVLTHLVHEFRSFCVSENKHPDERFVNVDFLATQFQNNGYSVVRPRRNRGTWFVESHVQNRTNSQTDTAKRKDAQGKPEFITAADILKDMK